VKRIIFDLDGTLLDVRPRHYAVYASCLREFRIAPLPYRQYWHRRRAGEGTVSIAVDSSKVDRGRFEELWLGRIESTEALRQDLLYSGTIDLLDDLVGRFELVLATLRRDRGALDAQLSWLGIAGYFEHVLTPERGVPGSGKLAMVMTLRPQWGTIVVGDSEADVALAQGLEAELICVTNGVRDESFLREAGATVLLPRVTELYGLPA
jgi:phosphoglycolate phosphatase